jgi:diguanylate cyclase (GGDEF)-like protein
VSLGTLTLLAYWLFSRSDPSPQTAMTLRAIAVYVIFGGISLIAVLLWPAERKWRVTLAAIIDQAIVFSAFALGGAMALPLLWGVFWFLIGSGCRYGRGTLAVSALTALAGALGLMTWAPWWQVNLHAGIGIASSICAVSIYLAVLLKRLEAANQRLERYAVTDSLTGISNRLYIEGTIATALQTGPRYSSAGAALLLIDLNGFKAINDTYGHATGDAVLQAVARGLALQTREGDTLARLGGDEFIVLVREAPDRPALLAMADNVHAMLGALTLGDGVLAGVSASIGVCRFPTHDQARHLSVQQLMRAADLAMYRAKSGGNGETAFADESDYPAMPADLSLPAPDGRYAG